MRSDGTAPGERVRWPILRAILQPSRLLQKNSLACLQQANWSAQHLPLTVLATRNDPQPPPDPAAPPSLTYPQFLVTARSQVAYAKEIHDTLVAAAQNISPTE